MVNQLVNNSKKKKKAQVKTLYITEEWTRELNTVPSYCHPTLFGLKGLF